MADHSDPNIPDPQGGLNAKQSRFVDEYLVDLNGARAARRAGYSQNNAAFSAHTLLNRPDIQAEIARRMEIRAWRTGINSDYVLHRLVEIDQLDVLDIMDDDGSLKPISDWPSSWRRSINGLDVVEIQKGDIEKVVKKLKWPDKLKNLDMLGKHVDVQAWKERVDHSSEDGSMTPKVIERRIIDPKKDGDDGGDS